MKEIDRISIDLIHLIEVRS